MTDIYLHDYGPGLSRTNGTDDWTTAFSDALADADTLKARLIIDDGKYLINDSFNTHYIDIIGRPTSSSISTEVNGQGPTLIIGSSVAGLFLDVGAPTTDGLLLHSPSILKGLTIDVTQAQNGVTAVGCRYGMLYKKIKDIHVRDHTSNPTKSSIATKNITAF